MRARQAAGANVAGERARNMESLLRVPLRLSEHRQLLVGLDLIAVNGALLLYLTRLYWTGAGWHALGVRPFWFVLLSALWLVLAYAFDAYEPRVAARLQTAIPAVAKAGVVTSVAYLLLPYVTPPLPTSRLAIGSLPVFLIAATLAVRILYTLVVPKPTFQRRALIIGTEWASRAMAEALVQEGRGSYQVVGFVANDIASPGTPANIEVHTETVPHRDGTRVNLPVLGGRETLQDLALRHGATTLVLGSAEAVDSTLLESLIACVERGLEVVPMPALYEQLTGRVPVEHVGERWHVTIPVHHPGVGALWRLVKRITDVLLAIPGLVALGSMLPVVALAIYLDSPGPIFYAQERVGRGGRIFRTYKFRSMLPNAEGGVAVWAQENDDRVTRVGRFLRATHLDEFPQFLNVFKGEMSAVGPRPERPEFADKLASEIPFYRLRHSIKPGMAGWGLIRQGYTGSTQDALIKLQYDLYYLKHQSLWLDLVIILKTIGHALAFKGR